MQHTPNRFRYEIDATLLRPDTEPYDTLCVVAWGAILTLVVLFWSWAWFAL